MYVIKYRLEPLYIRLRMGQNCKLPPIGEEEVLA